MVFKKKDEANKKSVKKAAKDKSAKKETETKPSEAKADTGSDKIHGPDLPAGFPAVIQGQYIKDLSFESPHAPMSIMPGQPGPELNVNFGLAYQKLDEKEDKSFYEVVTVVKVTAQREGKVVFLIEMQHGTSCVVAQDFPEDQLEPFLLTELPRYSFPFIRQLVATLTAQAGFTPLYLAPVNFTNLYKQRKAQEQAQNKEADASNKEASAGI